jgi:hypothetical protein
VLNARLGRIRSVTLARDSQEFATDSNTGFEHVRKSTRLAWLAFATAVLLSIVIATGS